MPGWQFVLQESWFLLVLFQLGWTSGSLRNLLLFFYDPHGSGRACQVVLEVKSPPANAQDIRGVGLIPGSGRSPGGVHGNPLQYFCLENPMDRGAWWTTVHRVSKSQTWLKQPSTHTHWALLLSTPLLLSIVEWCFYRFQFTESEYIF